MDAILRQPVVAVLASEHGRGMVADAVRETLARLRGSNGADPLPADEPALLRELTFRVEAAVRRRAASTLRRVINATGVVVHTNLGRSVLSDEAIARVVSACSGYTTLEYDLDNGRRGSRSSHLERLLSLLFPQTGSLAVNNNAAAIFLALHTLARGREVVLSRGEMVEIGGSFRIPDVLSSSGAILREVGTTNRTRLSDYEQALGQETGLILKVHRSNYRIVGFTQEVEVAALADLARRSGVPLVVDQGSGWLLSTPPAGFRDEPTARSLLDFGADLVTFSGDKVLGGPQAGIVLGRRDLIDRMRSSPLYRALRLDKMTIAALEGTLDAYLAGRESAEVPALRMILATKEEIASRAAALAESLRGRLTVRGGADRCEVATVDGVSRVGGGAAPEEDLPTVLVSVRPAGGASPSVSAWEERLRKPASPAVMPVVARVREDALLLDLRTVEPAEEEDLIEAVLASQP